MQLRDQNAIDNIYIKPIAQHPLVKAAESAIAGHVDDAGGAIDQTLKYGMREHPIGLGVDVATLVELGHSALKGGAAATAALDRHVAADPSVVPRLLRAPSVPKPIKDAIKASYARTIARSVDAVDLKGPKLRKALATATPRVRIVKRTTDMGTPSREPVNDSTDTNRPSQSVDTNDPLYSYVNEYGQVVTTTKSMILYDKIKIH